LSELVFGQHNKQNNQGNNEHNEFDIVLDAFSNEMPGEKVEILGPDRPP
jgi:hypothetical protein